MIFIFKTVKNKFLVFLILALLLFNSNKTVISSFCMASEPSTVKMYADTYVYKYRTNSQLENSRNAYGIKAKVHGQNPIGMMLNLLSLLI